MLHVQPVEWFTLTHPKVQTSYDFIERDGEVQVNHRTKYGYDSYTLPVAEARDLWRRLCRKGFERF